MDKSSRAIALLLALCIAAVTSAFLSLFDEVTFQALIVTFIISFSAGYLLSFIMLDFLIFREIDKIYRLFDKLGKKNFKSTVSVETSFLNPLKKINKEIINYAELKQQEIEELRKMETFRREFIADVSHELKTPIFAAQGFVHTLLDGAVKDKSVRIKFLKRAAKSLDGLDVLVQDLLILSQIETGEIKMHFEYFDIRSLAADVTDQFENKAERKEITLKFSEGTPDMVMVKADRQRINQVLNNLIGNAIKYSPEESTIEIGFVVHKKEVVTFVKDNGEGIPADQVNRIFERFYRVDKSRSREKGGTGLGLAIVKHILEEHRSKIEVSSVYGKGSTFAFKLEAGDDELPDILA